MEFRLLGPIEVLDGGQQVDLGPRKQRALLCLLLLHANRVVTTDRLLEELWGDDATGKENALWVAISRLRSALEPEREGHGESSVLRTRDHGYLLQVDPQTIDLTLFEASIAETRRLLQRDPTQAVERVEAALDLWRGTPLEEFHHEEFAQITVAQIEELRLEALELHAECELRLGRAREQISTLEALHKEHPLRERFVDLLMRSLYQAGRHADALRVFDRYRRALGDELGISPAPELNRLEEQILLHDPSLAPDRDSSPKAGEPVTVNPFKGLRSFAEEDATDFYGRDRLVSDVIRRIEAGQRLLALVGTSGSGKSSAVRAGIIPALRKGAIEGSDRWLVAQMVPGSRPLLELEAALLRSTFDPPDSLASQLTTPDVGLLRAALRILPEGARLVLVIDQFEELFALVDDDAERAQFLDVLAPAQDDPHGRVVVLLTLRADFYDRPLRYPEFARRLGDGVVNVSTLTPDELERAVQEPLRQAHVAIEPALLAALLTDVVGQPGALPLFQYTLTMLFDRRDADVLTVDAYRAMGGLKGALAQRADDLWAELDDAEQSATRQLFLRLVTITGEREWSRRRVAASELTSLRRDLVATQQVIEAFGRQRLLAFDRDQLSGSPTVEVAHEALLTEWPRLRQWIEEARDDVVRHAGLVGTMNEWRDANCSTGYLLTGQRLTDFETWVSRTTIDLTEHELGFLQHSIAARDDAERGETERAQRELALAKRVRRRTAGLVAVVLMVGIAALVAWWVARSPDVPRIAYVASPHPDVNIQRQERAGWEQAQRDHDFEPVEITPVSDSVGEMSALAGSGVDLMVVNVDWSADVHDVAAAHPDTRFLTFSSFPLDVGLPNVTVVYPTDDAAGGYLAGAAAALTTQTGTVGFLGAQQPVNETFRSGFEAGVAAVDPQVQVVSTYLTQTVYPEGNVFNNPDEGAEKARALYLEGADVVFAAAGSSGDRVPEVARQMSDEVGRQLWVIGVDIDQWLTVDASQQDHVLTSVVKRHDEMFQLALERFFAGELPPGMLGVGLADGVIGLSSSGDFLSGESVVRIEALTDAIAGDVVAVPDVPNGPPTLLADADTSIRVALRDGHCATDAPGQVALGSVIGVDFENASDEFGSAWLDIGAFPGDEVPDEVIAFGLIAGAGGTNAGVISVGRVGTWTVWCRDDEMHLVEPGIRIEVTA